MTVLAIKQRYPGHARQAGDDRQPVPLGRLSRPLCDRRRRRHRHHQLRRSYLGDQLRSDPAESIEILRRAWSGPLDPRIAGRRVAYSSRAIIDATRPYEWRDKFPKSSGASRKLKDKVAGDWREFLEQKIAGR